MDVQLNVGKPRAWSAEQIAGGAGGLADEVSDGPTLGGRPNAVMALARSVIMSGTGQTI